MLSKLGLVISAQFSATGFSRRWNHCNQLANYLARYVSASEADPERQATLLSTFFNEVLEVLYRNHPNGHIRLTFQKKGTRITLRAELPADDRSRSFYRQIVNLVSRPDLDTWYRQWLERMPGDLAPEERWLGGTETELDNAVVGVLELVAVYDAVIKIEEPKDSRTVLLYFDFPYGTEEME